LCTAAVPELMCKHQVKCATLGERDIQKLKQAGVGKQLKSKARSFKPGVLQ
jgi:hypothetical protein